MTIPKQVIEAAAREFNRAVDSDDHTGGWDDISEQDRDFYREAASRAISAALAAMWQPIESAGPSEDPIDIYVPWRGHVTGVLLTEDSGFIEWSIDEFDGPAWVPLDGKPTHWMCPLPLPTPKEEE